MLVEINLLPQKQHKSSTILRLLILLMFIVLVLALLTFWQVKKYNNTIDDLQNNIDKFQETIAVLQQNATEESTNSYVELSEAVEWSSNYQIKSVAVLKHLTSLLPERGFLLNYSYSEAGTVNLTVQFDTKKEAAYYMKWLDDSEWIKEVKLSELTSSQLESQVQGTGANTELENILPRYTGSFEITINREKIKASERQTENTDEKVEGGDNE